MRSVVSCRVVYSSLRKPRNSEPVGLGTTRSLMPETTQALPVGAAALDGHDGGAASRRRCGRRSGRAARRRPRSGPRRTPRSRSGRRSAFGVWLDEAVAEGQREFLDGGDAVLLGEREDGVLLGVGRQDPAWSPVVCASVKSPRSEVETFRSRISWRGGVAVDADEAVLGLAVLVGSQDDGHSRSAPSVGRVEVGGTGRGAASAGGMVIGVRSGRIGQRRGAADRA